MHRGLPCSKGTSSSATLEESCPSRSSAMASFSGGKSLTTTIPTCYGMLIYKYKIFKQDFNLKCSIQVLLLSFIFLLSGTRIYKNIRTSFINFGQN
jgi:hypothetical protein